MFGFEPLEAKRLGSAGRYEKRIEKFRAAGAKFPRLQHFAWWLLHNLVAHGLLGLFPCRWTFAFHDWSSVKLNAGMARTVPPPVLPAQPRQPPLVQLELYKVRPDDWRVRGMTADGSWTQLYGRSSPKTGDEPGSLEVFQGTVSQRQAKDVFCRRAVEWWTAESSPETAAALAAVLVKLLWGTHLAVYGGGSMRAVLLTRTTVTYSGYMGQQFPSGQYVELNGAGLSPVSANLSRTA